MVGKLSQQTEEVGAGRMTGKKEMAPGIKNQWLEQSSLLELGTTL